MNVVYLDPYSILTFNIDTVIILLFVFVSLYIEFMKILSWIITSKYLELTIGFVYVLDLRDPYHI